MFLSSMEGEEPDEGADTVAPLTRAQRKRRKRAAKRPLQLPPSMASSPRARVETKYYEQRHALFSLYDRGVLLDDESWYSVTPERLAHHHAARCVGAVLLDVCCGVGGNTIAFASYCQRVVAVDVDPLKCVVCFPGEHVCCCCIVLVAHVRAPKGRVAALPIPCERSSGSSNCRLPWAGTTQPSTGVQTTLSGWWGTSKSWRPRAASTGCTLMACS